MRGVRIRPATIADVDGLLRCLREAFEPYRERYTRVAYLATVLTATSARRRLRSMAVWVAADREGRILGTIALKRISRTHGHLRGMAVTPDFQGTGIASKLLRTAMDHSVRSGQRCVTLETTEPLDRAARFYLRHGFRKSNRTRHWGGMKLIEFVSAVSPSRPVPKRPRPRRNRLREL